MPVQFHRTSNHAIAYQYQPKAKAPTVLFLPGYFSDMTGMKAVYLKELCARENLGFLSLDYRGHGQSDGNFIDFTLSDWLADCLEIIQMTKANNLIIVGSSMGGWLMLLLQQRIPHLIKGLVGVAAAPDFSEKLLKLPDEQKAILMSQGHVVMPSQYNRGGTPLALKFIEDARQHLILDQEVIECPFPLRLLHGLQDEDVPYTYAEKIMKKVTSQDAWALLIKNGDHRLNEPQYLNQLGRFVLELSHY